MVCFTLEEVTPGIELELDKVRELPSRDASKALEFQWPNPGDKKHVKNIEFNCIYKYIWLYMFSEVSEKIRYSIPLVSKNHVPEMLHHF